MATFSLKMELLCMG